MTWVQSICLWAAGALVVSSAAVAQPAPSQNYATLEAVPGKPARIGAYGTVNKKECSPLRAPTIRVIESPSSGSLKVQTTTATSTPIAGCPAIKTPVQVLVYTAKANGDADRDRIVYEVTSANGEVATHEVTIKILPMPVSPGVRKPDQKT